ncbi:NB-ARC domain-containing protein [Dactylosporangium sp. NPDC005572]|uniref:NB-ARC domain-containing protein n=1 Tax=Dactylosporangium sp. NPDC005572 TaxID=3156889 RepID=UPI0033BA439C
MRISRTGRLGWSLVGFAVLLVCVAAPVWIATTGDVNAAAGWANILALPITAAGLMLVFTEQRRVPAAAAPPVPERRPWMAPPLERMVPRPELGAELLEVLAAPARADEPAEVGLTTALRGAGGFGKTRLATWVSHQPRVRERFPGGLLWLTIGQEVRGADLAVRINDLAFVLTGSRPALVDPDAAGAELGRILDEHERDPVLLVLDDVWDEAQLRPFRFGGRACTRLVTTRIPDLLPAGAPCVRVDAMSGTQARQLVAGGLPGLAAGDADRLAELAGHWPLLLNLVNGALRRRVSRGQSPQQAAREIAGRLRAEGPAAFDPARPVDRSQAVAATIDASLALLGPEDRLRYHDLAVFPEDVEIPLDVLALLWPPNRVEALCEELAGLGLVSDYRLDAPGRRLVLHDVMLAHLRNADPARLEAVHARLVDGAAGLVPAPGEWWRLPADARYLWRYLPYHLYGAGRVGELPALVCDPRWVEAKTRRFDSVVTLDPDLALVGTPTGRTLRRVLAHAAHLLGPIDPPEALAATLASRLHGIPGLAEVVRRYRDALPTPRLEPIWPLPDLPDPTQPTEPAGHVGPVTNCAFSPDGTLLATTGDDATIRLWRVPDGTQQALLIGHTAPIYGCAFSPDGGLLATAGHDGTVRLWRVADGTQRPHLSGHAGAITRCAFSPDGTLLASTGVDGTVRLWAAADGTPMGVLTGHTDEVNGCAFSPDGTLLATASADGTVRLWRVAAGTAHAVLTGHGGTVHEVAFSPDGVLLASTSDDLTTRVWRVADGSRYGVVDGHACGCAFSPDGSLLATAGLDRAARLYDVATLTERTRLVGHTARLVLGCAFSGDGAMLATTSVDGTARLWELSGGTERVVLTGSTDWAVGCAFSPDGGTLAVAKGDATVRLWRVADRAPLAVLTGDGSWMDSCAFSPDGRLVAAAGWDRAVRVWQADGAPHAALAGHTDRVTCLAFSPDGTTLATAGWDRAVRLWRTGTGTELARLTGHTGPIWGCAYSPDGTLLATSSDDRTVRVWRTGDGAVRWVLPHDRGAGACPFSPDGTLLATCDEQVVRLWNTATGTPYRVLSGHTGFVFQAAFAPDGTLLATTGNDSTIRIWQVATGRCVCALRLAGPVEGIAWHPDGTTICAVGGAGVYLLNFLPGDFPADR